MRVKFDRSALGQTKWHQYGLRFFFGGCVTALAGMVAMKFGPVIGGIFLAFPAIFPAGATLIEAHEIEKKQKVGLNGVARGRQAASIDATGAAIGSIGLLLFGLVVWQLLTHLTAWIAVAVATSAWLAGSVLLWAIRRRFRLRNQTIATLLSFLRK